LRSEADGISPVRSFCQSSGAAYAHPLGLIDSWDYLRCEFVFGDTGLALGDTAAVLKGKLGKITIIGTDSIDVRPQDEEEDEADEDD
jgi:hypothetical protein